MAEGPCTVRAGGGLAGAAEIQAAGQCLGLMPRRCVFWRERRTLIVSDLHLGKSETMGVGGIPMPAGVLERQLESLSAALAATDAARIIVVGDLLHAPAGLTNELVRSVSAWRDKHPAELVVVPGNHDRRLPELAETWRLSVTDLEFRDGPFVFRHEPIDVSPRSGFYWFGHVHPAVRLRAGGDLLKLACFHIGVTRALLPAASPFTAGGSVARAGGDRVFAIAGERVIEV